MMSERESKLKFYSLGIVAINKEKKSDHIKVTPIEELTLNNGKLTEQKNTYKVELPDAKGIERSSQVESDTMLIAKWIPFGQSNRITPPDVIAGETVIIFRFADTDEYYWTSIFREPGIRRLETVLYAFCNIPDGQEKFDKETSYWLEVSTDEKHIKLHTSKNNGEPYEYDITIDTENGKILIDDNSGNSIELNSSQNEISAIANTHILLKAPLVTIDAQLTHMTGDCVIDGFLTVGKTTKTNKLIVEDGSILNGGIVAAGKVSIDGSTEVTGDTEVAGNSNIGGNSEVSGALSSGSLKTGEIESGNITAGGNINASGEVHGSNI